jgi:sarcosine oxidase subunit gamma
MTQKGNVSMPEVVMESPLVGIERPSHRVMQVDGRNCSLSEVPFMAMLNLRGNSGDAAFTQAIGAATGLRLPVQANTCAMNGQRQLLWLGPDEWLLKTSHGQGEALMDALRSALRGLHAAVVAVGDGNTTLTVEGEGAAALLARGCPLDLHPRAFGAGAVAQSHLAKTNVTVLCLEAGQRYELTVRRSYADYLFRWLCQAGA